MNHAYFNQGSHDSFYYKMYFNMLRNILTRPNQYTIFLDIKDTRSAQKLQTLKEILCNNALDFTQQMINNIQNIHSHESEILQLADLLIGAVGYQHRNLVAIFVSPIPDAVKHSFSRPRSLILLFCFNWPKIPCNCLKNQL